MKLLLFNLAALTLLALSATAANFDVKIILVGTVPNAVNQSLTAAAARWASVMTAHVGGNLRVRKGRSICGQPPQAADLIIPDLLIFAQVKPIDGVLAMTQ